MPLSLFLFCVGVFLISKVMYDLKQRKIKKWTKKEAKKNKHQAEIKLIKLANEENLALVLKHVAQKLANEFWEEDFLIDIRISKKLDKKNNLAAYFCINDEKENIQPVCILISKTVTEMKNPYLILDLLKHELCHWYLSIKGKNFNDGDEDFEKELIKVGANSSGFFPLKEIYTKKTAM